MTTPMDPALANALTEDYIPPSRGSDTADAAVSNLTIDETLLLHSAGWEPVSFVVGASVAGIPPGTFTSPAIGWFSPTAPATAYARAVATAVSRIGFERTECDGIGVVGARMTATMSRKQVQVVLTGTAIRPVSGKEHHAPFVSDLGARDFCLLQSAGWYPVGIAFGSAYVWAPRRSVGTAVSQVGANAELEYLTDALYEARESGMERMQSSAISLGASGMVGVHLREGPLAFSHRILEFCAWGTAVRILPSGHQRRHPRVVMPLNDRINLYHVESLG